MKRLFAYTAIALLAAACSKYDTDGGRRIESADEGVVRMSIAMPSDIPVGEYDPLKTCKVRIYKYTDDTEAQDAAGDGGEQTVRKKELIRLYKSTDEIPAQIWLLAGDYSITVEAGDKEKASTVSRTYAGSQDFTVEAGCIGDIKVKCRMLNSAVRVVFDRTVLDKLPVDAYSYVCIADDFDISGIESGEVPHLRFEQDGTGYFLMPQGATTLSWFFHGEGDEAGTVEKTGRIENVKAAVRYTLTFRYSKDLGGSMSFDVEVDETPEIIDDTIAFSPDPTIKGSGFDPDAVQRYIGGTYTFEISALAAINGIRLTADGKEYDLQGGACDGITVIRTDEKHYSVTLDSAFFAPMYGGKHDIRFNVTDADGGTGTSVTVFATQGISPLGSGDYDLWYNTADFTATVLDAEAADIKIGYRTAGSSEWNMLPATASGMQADTYTARATDFGAGRQYEYRLFFGQTEVGAQAATETPAGTQVPNGDMENWHQSGNPYYPYGSSDTPFWDTGNPASTLLSASSNLTVPSDDIRPGSAGKYSAKLASTAVVGKFAAGNLFTGVFAGISGTNGLVDFGQPYTFTARPKALKFWYKSNCGTIDKTGNYNASGPDLTKIFIALCKWDKPHRVDTRDSGTFFDPRTADGVIACGYFESTTSCPEWSEKTLELTYNSDEKPDYLVIVFTSSGYGDYFTGSTGSWMYVDDIELVY